MSILLSLFLVERRWLGWEDGRDPSLWHLYRKQCAACTLVYSSHDKIVFLYSPPFFCVCFSLSYEVYDMTPSTREILLRSKKYCHRPKCPDGRLNLHSCCFGIVGAEVVLFFSSKRTQHCGSIQRFQLKRRFRAHTKTKTQTHWKRLVLSVAVCDTFCTVYRTLITARTFLQKLEIQQRITRVKHHLISLPGKSVIFLRTVYCCPAFFLFFVYSLC